MYSENDTAATTLGRAPTFFLPADLRRIRIYVSSKVIDRRVEKNNNNVLLLGDPYDCTTLLLYCVQWFQRHNFIFYAFEIPNRRGDSLSMYSTSGPFFLFSFKRFLQQLTLCYTRLTRWLKYSFYSVFRRSRRFKNRNPAFRVLSHWFGGWSVTLAHSTHVPPDVPSLANFQKSFFEN